MSTLVAVIQLNGGQDQQANLDTAAALVRRAAGYGARFIGTPENTNYLGPLDEKVRRAEPLDGPTVSRFRALARELGVTISLGSFNERSEVAGKCHNTSVLVGPDGEIIATYRKIHLFDIDLPPDAVFQESAVVAGGTDLVVARTPDFQVGLSICYDLRFPELYRKLVEGGAEVLTVPAAFTLPTGKDHWHPLLRARAIECQCYLLAAAQFGRHDGAGLRHSFGHAMIVDPWGHIIGMASDGPGLAVAELDLERVRDVRRRMPVGEHRRL